MRASVLTLAIALSGCALTLDATHLGVPASLASSAQGPDSGTAFSVTKHSVYLLVGLLPVTQPNLEDGLACQVGAAARPPNLRSKPPTPSTALVGTPVTPGLA